MGDVHKEPRCLSSGREKEKGLEKIFGLVSTKRMLELCEIQSQSVSFHMRMLREDKAIHAGIIAVEVDGVLGQLGHGWWVSTVLKLWI